MKTKINIHEVARVAGVSKSTVSRVISDAGGSVSPKALEAVQKAIKELGYTRNTLAAGLRTTKTYLILLMVPDIANPFWSEVARAVQDRLEAESYSVVVGNSDWKAEREDEYFALASSGRFDGLIANSISNDLGRFQDLGLPVVLIGERSEEATIDTVGTETYAATGLALEYLYGLGHRRIAIATSESGSERFLSRRYRAYEDFLSRHGLVLDPRFVFSQRLSEAGGRDLAARLAAMPEPPTAVFCGNDILAIGAINALRGGGLEPGEGISIIGMDDIPAAAFTYPGLTTIRKPRADIGAAAADLVIKRIREPQRPPEKHLFCGELVVRSSVVPVRNQV